jgi:hypothetical protein
MARTHRLIRLKFLALLPALALLAGCGDEMRKTFGLGKNAPDEFQVVRRAPLSLPPDFALRPPQPGAVRPQEGSVSDQARSTVLGQTDQAQAPAAPPVDPAAPAASPRSPVAAGTIGAAAPAAPRAPQAQVAAAPRPAPEPPGPSRAEVAFLRQAGAANTIPNIRTMIDEDLTKLAAADSRFIDKLLVWQKKEAPTSVVVDAKKENQRLQENAALGKSATDGITPTITRKKKGLLEGLFF